jgi:O-antigen/teichoic acid export membrane protein
MLPEGDEEAANILGVSLCSILLVTAATTLIIVFASDTIVRLVNSKQLGKYLWLIPITVFFSGLLLALNYWNSRKKHFGRLSTAKVVSSTTTQTTRLGLAFSGHTSSGVLIATNILGRVISAFVLAGQVWLDHRILFKKAIRWKRMLSASKRYSKFPIIDIWGALLNTVSWQLPALLLSVLFSPIIVGYYALSNAVIRLPMSMIAGAIGQVFYQKTCEAKNAGEHADIVQNVYRRLVAIGLFPMLILCLIGQDLFVILFGNNWSEAGLYTQILAPWMFFTFISSPLSTLFATFERQGSALIIHFIIFFTRLLSLYVGALLGSVYTALALFTITGVFVYSGLAIWNLRIAQVPTYFFLTTLVKSFLHFSPIGITLLFVKYVLHASSIILIFLSAISLGVYLIITLRQDPLLSQLLNFLPFSKKMDTV